MLLNLAHIRKIKEIQDPARIITMRKTNNLEAEVRLVGHVVVEEAAVAVVVVEVTTRKVANNLLPQIEVTQVQEAEEEVKAHREENKSTATFINQLPTAIKNATLKIKAEEGQVQDKQQLTQMNQNLQMQCPIFVGQHQSEKLMQNLHHD